ncbi:MAG: class I SAM-dependent methyltransferase [Planctomycetes bacterium]|nr:class I SAM-dependent methyltransferase [Planctomycetota bacterium]
MPSGQDKKAEAAFFDELTDAGDYDVLAERGYARLLGEFQRHIPSSRPLRCVDLGCGSGEFTARLAPLGIELHGIDLSPNAIALAQQRLPDASFRVGDIEDTGFEASSFDLVVLSGVLHHFPDLTHVTRECARILKPGGLALGYDPHRGNPFMRIYRCRDSPLYSSKGVTPNEEPVSRAKLEGAFAGAGFASTQVYPVSGVSFKFVESGVARIALPIYNALDSLLDLRPFRRFGSFLITVARR